MADGKRKALRLWVVEDGKHPQEDSIPQQSGLFDTQSSPAAGTPGALLKQHRIARNVTIEAAAAALRIPVERLQALEADRIDALPGRTVAIGFARAYAAFLGLDGQAIARQVGQMAAGVHRDPELRIHEPAPESRFPASALVATAVIAAIVAYGSWYYDAAQRHIRRDLVPPVPPQMLAEAQPRKQADDVPKPTAPPADQPAAGPGNTLVSGGSLGSPTLHGMAPVTDRFALGSLSGGNLASSSLTTGSLTTDGLTTGQLGPTALAASALPADSTVRMPVAVLPERTFLRPGEANAAAPLQASAPLPESRIMLRAVQDSWIEVRNVQTNQVVANQILRAGATMTPPAGNYKLTTGNAGGLEIAVDGAAIASFGSSGAVVRDIPLDADRLKAGYTPPPRR